MEHRDRHKTISFFTVICHISWFVKCLFSVLRNGREKASGNALLGHTPLIPGNKAFYCPQLYSRNSPVRKNFCHLLRFKSTFDPFKVQQDLSPHANRKEY